MVIANESYVEQGPQLPDQIKLYYTPILVNLGLLGNCLSVCVFLGTKLRYSSSSIYLGVLAISDIGFLTVIFVDWLTLVNVKLFTQPGFCQFFMYFGSCCSFLSVWLVVAFTVERFVAVKWPLRRQSLCTVARAKATIAKLMALAVFWCIPVPLFIKARVEYSVIHGRDIGVCNLDDDWEQWARVYNNVDAVLTFAVPFSMIVIFNVLIARNIYRHNHTRRNLTIESDERSACGQPLRDRMPQTKVTNMLLLVSTTFFCLNTPSYVFRILAFLLDREPQNAWLILVQQICYQLFNTSYGINFVLYCASGQKFRRAMVSMFTKRSSTRRATIALMSYEKPCEITHNSTKRLHSIGDEQWKNPQDPQDPQEIRKSSMESETY